ncbi:Alpha-monoglucosyldiacylglycerol synthase [termite gut metagenome]|uniref:Alpha-monoglucosyldiacylglycerol synthase n=1 Tax=termite gut metagenome TaxID=433724 RepID=A0A5J4RXR8_9ZZZZ
MCNKHIVIIRTGGNILNDQTYNCQELGLAKALVKKNIKVSVIFAGNNRSHYIEKVNDNRFLHIYFVKFYKINQALSWFRGFFNLLENITPDIIQIHEFGMLMSYVTLRWAKKHNIKTVLIQGSYRETKKPIFKQFEQLFNCTFGRYIIKNIDGIGCKTLMASNYLNRYRQCNTSLIKIGLDINHFENPIDKNWLKDLQIEGKKILLYVGVMERRRNVNFILKLLKELPEEFILLLIGVGKALEKLKLQAKGANIENRCCFLGQMRQEQLPSLYSIADLFLLASDYEIYGMVILESMYFGVPVISSFTAGSQTIIEDKKDGLLINYYDVYLWKEYILSIYDNHKLEDMREAAKIKIQQSYIWYKASESFISLYESIEK